MRYRTGTIFNRKHAYRYGFSPNANCPICPLGCYHNTSHAFKVSPRPDAILFLPSTVCSSRVTTRNSIYQHLAIDKKSNTNRWEVHLIEFKFCEDTWPDSRLQKAKAQRSMLIANLNRQGYREFKLHVILVGAMGTIYKDYADEPLADLNLDYHNIKKRTN